MEGCTGRLNVDFGEDFDHGGDSVLSYVVATGLLEDSTSIP